MYERFYQLRDRPFALSPDPDYLYPSRVHREALDYLRFGIEGHAGFVVITGEIGSGKTTLLQVLLRNLDGNTTVIRLVNTLLTGRELIESMLLDLGIENPPTTKPSMLHELARRLIEQRASGRRVLAVIDEAQNLSLEALEELRMLSNLETEKSKLIQIVLVGQPDLRDSLDRPSLEQLRQRVTVRYHIGPLAADETAQYINHRLKRAAAGAPLLFPPDVTNAVHVRSGGVPRMINVICDAVLLCGYAEEAHAIDLTLVRMAIDELEASSVLRRAGGAVAPSASAGAPESAARRSEAAAPIAPASGSARATAPPAPLADLPLRQQQVAPRGPDMAFRQKPERTWTLDLEREQARMPAARTSGTPQRAVPTPRQVAAVRAPAPAPRAYKAPPERPARAWTWVKDVFFGPAVEAERR